LTLVPISLHSAADVATAAQESGGDSVFQKMFDQGTIPMYTYSTDTTGAPEMTTDPHHAEYLAAVAGMPTHTPPPPKAIYADGVYVTGITAGRRWAGYVEWCEAGRLSINVGGAWIYVPAEDVLESSDWTESH
jgi:hypothetical protein